MTRNKDDFRASGEILNGYYIEYNIDSHTKFGILKKLLTLFELEDELTIKYKNDDENHLTRFSVRKKYWQQLLPLINGTELFSNVSASKDHWLSSGAGISGLGYVFVVTQSYARVELTIGSSSKDRNKRYFNKLIADKKDIEQRFGKALEWEELAEYKMSRIKSQINNVSLFNPDDWDEMNKFLITTLPKFERAIKPSIQRLKTN
jgi:hypothetical protein